MRKAKIVCTIGPSTNSPETIKAMAEAGMDVARLNFSHESCDNCRELIKSIRSISKEIGRPIAILSDLKGVKIRISEIADGGMQISENQDILVAPGSEPSTPDCLYVSYPALVEDVKIGEKIYIDDGTIKLVVTGKRKGALEARFLEGKFLKSRKGANLPDTEITMDTFTEKDKGDLRSAINCGIDFIATSFVRTAEDVKNIIEWTKTEGLKAPHIIAKIERPQAVRDIDSILEIVDGIMVARGDLGVESLPEEVPVFQKMLIEKANRKGKFVITATQMMESMIDHTRPTRAEASDVANAVLDGSDALMLAAETAAGKFPVETVKMMNRIITYTETELRNKIVSQYEITGAHTSEAIADGACRTAHDINAKAIVAFTQSGFLAQLIAKNRPSVPVIAITPGEATYQRLTLCWGTKPLCIHGELSISELEKYLEDSGVAFRGDRIIMVASSPFFGKRNTMRIHQILNTGQ